MSHYLFYHIYYDTSPLARSVGTFLQIARCRKSDFIGSVLTLSTRLGGELCSTFKASLVHRRRRFSRSNPSRKVATASVASFASRVPEQHNSYRGPFRPESLAAIQRNKSVSVRPTQRSFNCQSVLNNAAIRSVSLQPR